MKKIILGLFIIISVGCVKKEIIDYSKIIDKDYINNNKNMIDSVIVHKTTNGSDNCYNVDIEEAYKSINDLKIIKKAHMSVTDDYLSYTFYFKDETKTIFSFEGPYLYSNKETYIIEFDRIILKEEDIVNCRY